MNQALSSLGWIVAASAVAMILGLIAALDERDEPRRCGPGLESFGPVCCAPGQRFDEGVCRGVPRSCPPHMHIAENEEGCVVNDGRVLFDRGRLQIGPSDWESQQLEARTIKVEPFELDAFEVTAARWRRCVAAKVCAEAGRTLPPGLPITSVSPQAAQRFCEFSGGRLPTGDEWVFAAAGAEGRRFPWGQTGLTCRRAAWGLVSGPCAKGATRPTLVGSRASGRTPRGLFDMAGNVAEWTVEGAGAFAARGGSYRSRVARQLKSWSSEKTSRARPDIGFRCAYDVETGEANSDE